MRSSLVLMVLASLFLGSCSSKFRAEQAEYWAKDYRATPYQEAGFFDKIGYSEDRIDSNTVQIFYRANGLTSRARHVQLVTYHAAKLAQNRGEAVFLIEGFDRYFVCSPIANIGTYANATAKFGLTEPYGPDVLYVDKVIADLEADILNPPDDYETRQRILLGFTESCASNRMIEPEEVKLNSELPGAR